MASVLPEGRQSFTDSAGAPLVGGKLWTYDAGTSTPRPTYADASGTVENTNPVILDARGEAAVYWDGAYKVVLQDAAGSTIWTQDNIVTQSSGSTVTRMATRRVGPITATAGQTVFPLGYTYTPGTGAILCWMNGILLPASEYVESSATDVTLVLPAAGGEEVEFLVALTSGVTERQVWIEASGADPSGAVGSSTAIAAAIATLGAVGGTVLAGPGTFLLDAETQVPPYVNLVGAGIGATTFKCTTSAAKLRWIRGSADGRGGESGGFSISGNAVATNPMQLDVCVERNFRNIDIHGCVAGGAGIIINGAQNCNFYGVHSQNNSGSNLILDYGAGNNRFHGCELSQALEWNVKFQQSGPTPDGGFSAGPTSNRFIGCILERAYAASQGMIYHGAGRFNSFSEVDLQFGPITTAKSMVVVEKASSSYDSYLLNFHNCNWSGSAGKTTAIECRANTSVHMSGRHSFENHAAAFSVNDAASVVGAFYVTLGGVTKYFTNQGGGTQTQANLIRNEFRGQQQYVLPAGQSAITIRDETKSFSGVLISPSKVLFGDGAASATRYIESGSPYSLKGIKLNDISAPSDFVLSLGAIDIIVTSAAPTQAAPNGSLALRTGGGTGTTFYVRELGVWIAK